ncbi:2-C-methyl-D-erythritol 4-phosphate cytidylyltransferase [Lapillicoccus jejuensis]|uniref:2-C-methyl-D-erythritol 4-phosphate cytidylyltransferase n=1 Tax=Lapillicoccus jejuensis TaxID=402171 RepID=UPI00114EA0D7|nr:2-C-methyl-D-erythritol 4-phosphate cytidylyltransferase [Lapillicoccus jejuensis]
MDTTHTAAPPPGPRGAALRVAVVVVAAGSGSRLGAEVPKAFVRLADRPLLAHALERAGRCPGLVRVVVVAPASHVADALALTAGVTVPTQVVAGGAERSDSVAAGLAAAGDDVDAVLVHDAARALAPPSLFAAVVAALAEGHPAVVPGLPVVDTVKEVDKHGVVVATPDRSRLRAVQTPQGFDRAVLARAHADAPPGATDDAALVERLGLPVVVVPGDPLAEKVTTPRDLAVAHAVLAGAGPR